MLLLGGIQESGLVPRGVPVIVATGVLFIGAVVPPLVICRLLYPRLRWRLVKYEGRYCRKCNYILTGNISGICPECGTPVARPDEAEGK